MKKYTLPEDAARLLSERNAMYDLSGIYAKIPFGYKKAVKARKEGNRLQRKAILMVKKLNPECNLNGKFHLNDIDMYIAEGHSEQAN